ncbi:hypothetical protein PHLGIDRAFT_333466 [Phlebiopsis gigantea 11061_1 CR5-6]|uniref:Uncharacterized protein n=1 Tax=Phlebiopsis gigantea (strain 11061_1 CR5-6) TaxID=745531 RepID=A0A0C3PQH0_PHLG1|nr:hypothetical protein PHLGIDRAFT_333466 [Phlebiopsis gigantea 11061_1 CR5-6]
MYLNKERPGRGYNAQNINAARIRARRPTRTAPSPATLPTPQEDTSAGAWTSPRPLCRRRRPHRPRRRRAGARGATTPSMSAACRARNVCGGVSRAGGEGARGRTGRPRWRTRRGPCCCRASPARSAPVPADCRAVSARRARAQRGELTFPRLGA